MIEELKSLNTSSIKTKTSYGAASTIRVRDTVASKINRQYQSIKSPLMSYFPARHLGREEKYYNHEYELYEHGRIIDTEAIVARAFSRKRALIFKNGYKIVSDNEENLKYIRQRLKEFKYVSGVSFDEFLRELSSNIIMFHNAYIFSLRDIDMSTGKRTIYKDKLLDPIAAYYNVPTESIERVIDSKGRVTKYRQRIHRDKFKVFNKYNIKHLTYNKRSGFTMGTPPLEAVKDDILALRRIEESVETLIYKSLFPIIHVQVGTKDQPARVNRDGTKEVDEVRREVEMMDDSGGLVTSERVNITAIGAESLALRVESYLNYFKNRVMIGLGMSSMDLGEGGAAGRNAGEVVSQVLKEEVLDFQRLIAGFITDDIFSPLLVESGRYDTTYNIDDNDTVRFIFDTVDTEANIKLESHYINMYNSNLRTSDEIRTLMGLKVLTEEEKEALSKEKSMFAPKLAGEGQQSTPEKQSENLAKNVSNPKNQHNSSLENDISSKVYKYRDDLTYIRDTISTDMKLSFDKTNAYIDNIVDITACSVSDHIKSLTNPSIEEVQILLCDAYTTVHEQVQQGNVDA